uniref:Cation efflux protein cytoplasmic domain-containing protein n=1 Tax=Anas platyrhynchos platyrhynchos TaxID=8840 RepID=A0A493T3U5_ANAPP
MSSWRARGAACPAMPPCLAAPASVQPSSTWWATCCRALVSWWPPPSSTSSPSARSQTPSVPSSSRSSSLAPPSLSSETSSECSWKVRGGQGRGCRGCSGSTEQPTPQQPLLPTQPTPSISGPSEPPQTFLCHMGRHCAAAWSQTGGVPTPSCPPGPRTPDPSWGIGLGPASPCLAPLAGAPRGIEFDAVKEVLLAVSGVRGTHDLHIWALTLSHPVVSVHVAVDASANPETVLREATSQLQSKFGFVSCTVQVERYQEEALGCPHCQDPRA